jgi:hypothetical protein
MAMWKTILGIISGLVSYFFGGSDERDKERDAGERLGQAESQAQSATQELEDAQKAADARNALSDATDAILRDSNNAG